MRTEDITLDTADGPMRLYVATPDERASAAVIVIQEAFGLNDHIEDVTRRFADAGYLAVAPELFHRAGGGTAPYDDFSKAMPLFAGMDDDAVLTDIDATLGYLGEAGVPDEHVGIVGFCLGGRISLLVALRRPIGAGVSFYGGGIVKSRFPQFPALAGDLPDLTVAWLGLFGDLDKAIPIDEVEQVRAALVAAKADTDVVRYPDADHGFHCDQRSSYNAAAATDAWARTIDWFGRHLVD